jgi:SAM-dependent methyltransferase
MDETKIKELVRARYGGIAKGEQANCCGPAGCCDGGDAGDVTRMGYSEAEAQAAPESADLSLGCGNPQAIAAMRPGETVLDLGSGAGFDCFLAARQVGPTGHVIGVDMTHEMLARARANAARLGAANVEFRLGEIEHLPVADATADVIISNCVINLAPDKAQVFREAFRALKPGGRLAISDVLNTAEMPAALQADPDLMCKCATGAAPASRLQAWLAAAGFVDIRISEKPESRDMIAAWSPGSHVEDYVVSGIVVARKPA